MVADLCTPSRTAVELVNPKHRNERKYRMALITSYHVPGLYVEDHSIDVPLDWRGLEPMLLAVGSTMRRGAMPAPIAGAPESIKLFYRVVCAPDRINDDLPLLRFLQGGPGGESPRPLSPTSDGWIEAVSYTHLGSVNQHLQWPLCCVLEQESWSQGRKHELRERIGRHK